MQRTRFRHIRVIAFEIIPHAGGSGGNGGPPCWLTTPVRWPAVRAERVRMPATKTPTVVAPSQRKTLRRDIVPAVRVSASNCCEFMVNLPRLFGHTIHQPPYCRVATRGWFRHNAISANGDDAWMRVAPRHRPPRPADGPARRWSTHGAGPRRLGGERKADSPSDS